MLEYESLEKNAAATMMTGVLAYFGTYIGAILLLWWPCFFFSLLMASWFA